jgi:hypothetical protein
MWDKLKQQASTFQSAVLTTRDADGYPVSVRTSFNADDARHELRVAVPPTVEAQPGPASLLFHQHNDQLWNLRIVLVRGELAHTGNGWVFRPQPITPSPNALRMILSCRKTAQAYLRKRGLARPPIPWDRLKAIKER